MKRFLVIGFLSVLLVITCVACSTEAWERAEAQKYDAMARAESAPIVAQVPVIEAETNALLTKLAALEQYNKSMRSFDAQMSVQQFTTTVLQFQALELAIRKETDAAQRVTAELKKAADDAASIGHNTSAAANNSYWILLAFIPFGAVLFGLTVFCVVMFIRLERRK